MPAYDYLCPSCGPWEARHPYPPPAQDACPTCSQLAPQAWLTPPRIASFTDSDGTRYMGKAKMTQEEMMEDTPWEGRDDYHLPGRHEAKPFADLGKEG